MAIKALIEHPNYIDFVDRYAFDLFRFAIEVVGITPTKQQQELFSSVCKVGSRTSVRSGHGTGKTSAAAIIALWHLTCYHQSNTFLSAPKIDTLRQGIWKEFADHKQRIASGHHSWIAEYIVVEIEKVYILGEKMSWFCVARTAPRGSPESLAGAHRDWLLWFIDEASGVPDANFGVIGGSLTDARNRMVCASQPTRQSGMFYDQHNSLSTKNGGVWTALTFNSEKSPLVSDSFLHEKLIEYGGATSEHYQIKVRGEFPEDTDGNLLGRKAIESCFGRVVIKPGESYGIILSIDVGAGEYRDKSVALVAHVSGYGDFGPDARRVQIVDVPIMSNTRNIQDFTGDVFRVATGLENCSTLVDAGGMGIAVCQSLETLGLSEIRRVKWGKPCWRKNNADRFFNQRAQAMVCAARAAKEGRLGIADGHWRKDLLDQASRMPYHFDEKARYKIESKEEMRKHGLPSPDLWDALSQIFLEDANYMIAEGSLGGEIMAANSAKSTADDMFADVD